MIRRFLLLLILLPVALFAQGQNIKGTFGYGPPAANDPAATNGVGTQFVDINTGSDYMMAMSNGSTWSCH